MDDLVVVARPTVLGAVEILAEHRELTEALPDRALSAATDPHHQFYGSVYP
jgi:hypothetical protein